MSYLRYIFFVTYIFFLLLQLLSKSFPWLGISSLLISLPTIIQIEAQGIFLFDPSRTRPTDPAYLAVGRDWWDMWGEMGRGVGEMDSTHWDVFLNHFQLE